MNLRNTPQIVALIFALTLTLLVSVMAQEVDYNEEQYQKYTEAVGKEDPGERCAAIIEFVQENPKLTLVKYAVVKYVEVLQDYQNQGNFGQVLTLSEQLLAVISEDSSTSEMKAATIQMAGVAAFQMNNFEKAAQYVEPSYAANPSPGLLYILAISNQNLNNTAKFLEYGEQIVESLEPQGFLPGHFQIAAGLRGAYVAKDLSKAAVYARKITNALEAVDPPQGTTESQWRQYANAERSISYAILGQLAVKQENWGEAISHYQRVIQYTNDKDALAEAYYFIGRGRWQQNRLDPAMEAFAMGSVQKGAQNAGACRNALERLYRSTHNGSLAGLDEFIVNATVK